jgi:hypothetical protein
LSRELRRESIIYRAKREGKSLQTMLSIERIEEMLALLNSFGPDYANLDKVRFMNAIVNVIVEAQKRYYRSGDKDLLIKIDELKSAIELVFNHRELSRIRERLRLEEGAKRPRLRR